MADKYKGKKPPKYAEPKALAQNTALHSTPAASEASYDDVKKEHRFYFNIVKRRYIWFALSLVLIIAGIISLFVQGLNLGIDFTGGSMFTIQFNEQVTQSNVQKAVDSLGIDGTVQLSNGDKTALIRTETLDPDKRDALLTAIEKQAGAFDRQALQENLVAAAIGTELQQDALKALGVAAVLILLYVSFRFRFLYAVSAVIALLHDIVITVGIVSLFQLQVDATFIAAILTVFGYSINDTVVIYDRIRENEKRMKKRDSFEDMVDKSVWQTMGRSLKTVGTVLIALLAINILGGDSTKVFAFVMLIGVFFGCYSSIFVASQLVVEIKKRTSKEIKKESPSEA
ncbi:protein translocase subunit SecF [Dehalobacter sp. DCM]|uniref:protein translocase subunit SecF n=1 Tax=Dehalobacter sp. DCM TaxID=2907827 RepID=UPI003081A972|nr:protein translocase subunit SecF [Dehalobacter sp. DCM]